MPYRLFMSVELLIDEFMKVKLLAILGEQLPEEKAVMEIFLEVGDAFGELYLVVEPVQQQVRHGCYRNTIKYN